MVYRDENIDELGLLYGHWKVMNGVWVITNRWKNFMYLLIGNDKAILIDTGNGEGNIRKLVESITDKPLIIINTHGHFDHTGGNGWWEEVGMSKEAFLQADKPFTKKEADFFKEKPYKNYKKQSIKDGDIISLGHGRDIEIISIAAHNESSIALLDKKKRLLFTGDEIEAGQVLLFVRNNNMPTTQVAKIHKKNMEKLKKLRSEYDFICPSHNGFMLEPDQYIDDFIELDKKLISGTIESSQDTAGFGFPAYSQKAETMFKNYGKLKRYEYSEASFVCQEEQG